MKSQAETQQLPAAGVDTKPGTTVSSGPGDLTWWAPVGEDKKIMGTVKWFIVKNRYGFINKNYTKEDVFVHQIAIKNNLRSVGDEENRV